jgi:hypothetical protein
MGPRCRRPQDTEGYDGGARSVQCCITVAVFPRNPCTDRCRRADPTPVRSCRLLRDEHSSSGLRCWQAIDPRVGATPGRVRLHIAAAKLGAISASCADAGLFTSIEDCSTAGQSLNGFSRLADAFLRTEWLSGDLINYASHHPLLLRSQLKRSDEVDKGERRQIVQLGIESVDLGFLVRETLWGSPRPTNPAGRAIEFAAEVADGPDVAAGCYGPGCNGPQSRAPAQLTRAGSTRLDVHSHLPTRVYDTVYDSCAAATRRCLTRWLASVRV